MDLCCPQGKPIHMTLSLCHVAATRRAVLQRGLRDTTASDIAEAASLSRRTFYQPFGSREEACRALYEEVVRELVEHIQQAISSEEEPVHRLFSGLSAYLDSQQEGGDLVALLQTEAASPDSLLAPLRERVLDEMGGLVDTEVQQNMGLAMASRVYRMLFLALEGLVIQLRNRSPYRPRDRTRVESIAKRIFVQIQILAAAEEMPSAPEETLAPG